MNSDQQAWDAYPHHHNWFNKLYVSEKLGYKCGPGGTLPNEAGHYIVRPIYNLRGMGIETSLQYLDSTSYDKVPPGHFWCQYFEGKQYSATYKYVNRYWEPVSCWEGSLPKNEFTRFKKWTKTSYAPAVPELFNVLSDVKIINIEFINDKPFEVHLRDTPDPNYNVLIPIWKDTARTTIEELADSGYVWIESFDDADGFIDPPRIGFMVK